MEAVLTAATASPSEAHPRSRATIGMQNIVSIFMRLIGIGGASRTPSSHTTVHTGHVHGGSDFHLSSSVLCLAHTFEFTGLRGFSRRSGGMMG